MTTLREAAQQALEALKLSTPKTRRADDDYAEQGWKEHNEAITSLRAALAEPVQEPVAWMRVIDGKLTNNDGGNFGDDWMPLYTAPPRCANCASLEDQNTELDKKLADLEQTSLELCETCGWRTLIPGDVCLNCTRSDPDELTVAYMMGAQSRMRKLTDEVIAELWHKNAGYHHHFARAIERWLKGEKG